MSMHELLIRRSDDAGMVRWLFLIGDARLWCMAGDVMS